MIMNMKKSGLSIRHKLMLVISVSIILLASTLYGISFAVLPASYSSIEQAALLKDLGRAEDAIGSIYTLLNEKLLDWAAWDDTYEFVIDLNKDYLNSNLSVDNLVHLNINALAFTSTDGRVVFSRAIDLASGEEVDSGDITLYLESHKDLTTHTDVHGRISGVLPLPGGPFLFVSQPILTSQGEGPIHGSLIFGKYINKTVVDSIAALTHLSVQTFPYGDSASPADVVNAERLLTVDNDHTTTPLSDTSIVAYKLLRDYYSNPLLTLRVETPRDIHTQGRFTTTFLTIAASVLICIFGIILTLLLERFIVSRFTRLSENLMGIAGQNNFTLRVKEGGNDEIGELALTINDMLDRVVASESAEREAKAKMLVATNQLQAHPDELRKLSALMADKERKIAELTKEIEKLKR
jgi:sensor domain CHASE-containing protein